MAENSALAVSLGVALILAQILWKLIDTKMFKNGNGNGYGKVNGYTDADRLNAASIVRALDKQTGILELFTQATLRYQERGVDAMALLPVIQDKVDETREHLAAFTNQLILSNTQTNNALAALLSNDREHLRLLDQIDRRLKP